MPSTSIAQQRLMGQAYALKTGELKSSDLDPKYRKQIEDLAASMTEKDLKDFAETSHKGLPQKVKETYTMNKHIPTFESFVNEEVNEKIKSDFKPGDKVGLISISTKKKFDSGVVSNIQKDGNVVVVDTNFIGEVVIDPKFLVKESINEGHPSVDPYAFYDSMDDLKQDLKQTKDQFKGKDIPEWAQKRIEFLEDGIKNKVIKESIDVKYWSAYNDDAGVQGQSKHYSDKSTDFEDTFEDAVTEWNQEADGAENMIKGAKIQKIKKLAQEFFKQAGWISVNVIQAMIMQES